MVAISPSSHNLAFARSDVIVTEKTTKQQKKAPTIMNLEKLINFFND